jgi:DNA polymerase I-like protein with 3'-5' exonuclease and polymerase domains
MYNPVSRLWYSLREEKDIFSTLNQGTGVWAFDTWIKHVRSRRPQLTGQFHDEIILQVRKGNREKCEELLRWAIDETNKELSLHRELDIDIQFGDNYAAIH